ncbi:unnamed protein product [Echinostoma caproni]|uniref:DDHD domain-containing protein n=1 Tax=Echinostoma caproni TaxID=27848 RepID=A0A183AX61_9TREM|nr:unnamed protein product [Echinostoma caproni]
MELFYFEKRRRDLLEDHPYALLDNTGTSSYKGESILTDAIQDLSIPTDDLPSCGWVSVDVEKDSVRDTQNNNDHGESDEFFAQAVHAELEQARSDPRHYWVQPSVVFRKKMLNLLEKCHLQQTLDNSRINSLLTVLNRLSRERGISSPSIPETPITRTSQLSDNAYRFQSRQQQHPYSGYDPRFGLSSAFPFSSNTVAGRQTGDEVILACFTFPASPTSNRLNRLLNELSEIGRVSVETPEEQACDVMRLRFRLYNRRILTLLEEPKRGPIYLVGFGVGSILVLSSAMHLQSVDDRYGIAGIICLGMPLVGLKGPRGYPNDPLLSVPEVPILFIVGSASRLGGHKQALYFRSAILHARLRSQLGNTPDGTDASRDSFLEDSTPGHAPSSPGTSSFQSKGSSVSVLTVGGADYLLRLRPSLCEKWYTTQEEVDKRIVVCIDFHTDSLILNFFVIKLFLLSIAKIHSPFPVHFHFLLTLFSSTLSEREVKRPEWVI